MPSSSGPDGCGDGWAVADPVGATDGSWAADGTEAVGATESDGVGEVVGGEAELGSAVTVTVSVARGSSPPFPQPPSSSTSPQTTSATRRPLMDEGWHRSDGAGQALRRLRRTYCMMPPLR